MFAIAAVARYDIMVVRLLNQAVIKDNYLYKYKIRMKREIEYYLYSVWVKLHAKTFISTDKCPHERNATRWMSNVNIRESRIFFWNICILENMLIIVIGMLDSWIRIARELIDARRLFIIYTSSERQTGAI